MSQPSGVLDINVQTSPPDVDDDDDEVTLDDIITAFLDAIPNPTDDQVHAFAQSLGISPDEFEEVIYEMLTDYVEDLDSVELDEGIRILQDRDGPDADPMDILLLGYFGRHPDPTDQQIHQLAISIGMTPDELEERLFSMVADITGDDESSD